MSQILLIFWKKDVKEAEMRKKETRKRMDEQRERRENFLALMD